MIGEPVPHYLSNSLMASPDSDSIKSLISERLKLVDSLVKAKKIDEAIKEIIEIRKLDVRNPYAYAYEERIKAMQQSSESRPTSASPAPLPSSPATGKSNAPPAQNSEHADRPASQPASTVVRDSERPVINSVPSVPEAPKAVRDATPEAERKRKTKGNILLVDDDELLARALADVLEDEGYATKSFHKAEDALDYLKENSPDLVLCDVNLESSKFGGFTLHDKMRAFPHLHQVPFIFLSGLNDRAIVRAGKEIGADDYLTKPVEPEALLSVVKGKLRRYREIKKGG